MEKRPLRGTKFLSGNGKITPDLIRSVSGVLDTYVETARFWSNKRGKAISDYALREAFVVGSVLDGNGESDLDLLLIADKIDYDDYRFIKQVMAQVYFVNRPKTEAVDVFVRPHDEFPERGSYEITDQVEGLISHCNARLTL